MAYLFHILAAVASLALPSVGPRWSGPEEASGLGALMLMVLVVPPYVLARAARGAAVAGRFRGAGLFERAASIYPVATQAAAVALFGWLELLDASGLPGARVADWPDLSVFLALAPFLVTTILSIDARARSEARRGVRATSIRSLQLRLFVSALAPFALFLAVSGAVGRTWRLRVEIEEVSLSSAAFTVLLLALFIFTLPRLLSALWGTRPLDPGPLRSLLEDFAARAKFRCRELLVWPTGSQMANAAILGFTPRTRVVLFTDALLAMLDPLEVAAVFGHEIGHARRRHAAVFAAWAIGVLLAADSLAVRWVGADSEFGPWIVVAGLALWLVAFRFLSRRFELEADLESLELVGDAAPLVTSLAKITNPAAFRKHSWRHFSTADRIAFLQAVERDPRVGVRLRRRLRQWGRLGWLLLAVVLVMRTVELAGPWRAERLAVDLRLGRFEEAARGLDALEADGVEPDDERLAPLIRLAVSLDPAERTPEAIEEAARLAFLARSDDRAARLLDLATLLGDDDAEAPLAALEARREGARDEESEAALSAEWRSAFRSRFR